jgi:hypothetical protein
VRQLAWLDRADDATKRPRRQTIEAEYPVLLGGEYLLSWLSEIGICRSTGMGAVGVDYAEIHAWSVATATQISGMEARLLHRLSGEYAAQYASDSSISPLAESGANDGTGRVAAFFETIYEKAAQNHD